MQVYTSLATGIFTDTDRVHQGQGSATIFRGADGGLLLRLADDFRVTNGPDLFVWLVRHPGPTNSADVRQSEYIELGRLKGNIGDQNYQNGLLGKTLGFTEYKARFCDGPAVTLSLCQARRAAARR